MELHSNKFLSIVFIPWCLIQHTGHSPWPFQVADF